MDQYHNANQPGQQLPSKDSGAWDFLNTPAAPPKQPSFFQQQKKLIIIAVLMLLMLVGLAVAAAFSSENSSSNDVSLEGPSTSVPLADYDGEAFRFSHAASLKIDMNEKVEESDGWFVLLSDNIENPSYDIAVETSNNPSIYVDGEEAVNELLPVDITAINPVTTDVAFAGVLAKKTVAEYTTPEGLLNNVVYVHAEINGKYLTVSGTYRATNQEITDSFDAMIGSIALK